jgi:hypothetical protein
LAAPKLCEEQRIHLLEWLAAGNPYVLIVQKFLARGWEPISIDGIKYHHQRHKEAIDRRRQEREEAAFDRGYAQWQTRVKALVYHAENLDDVKWLPDEKGKLHNEKAWRETLDDIAKEMGHRKGLPDAGTMTAQQLIEALTGKPLAAAEVPTAPDSEEP